MTRWSDDDQYADASAYFARRAELVVSVGPRLEPGDTVLDLACADGRLAEFLAPYGIDYRGVDTVPELVKQARAHGIEAEVGDLNDYVPPNPVSTEVARGLLPATVPHQDAAADAGRTALLVAALGGRRDFLLLGTRDYLHQDYRRSAMPESLDLVDWLRGHGLAAFVSGAGPTVLVLADSVSVRTDDLATYCPDGWEHHMLLLADEGVRVI